MSTRHLLSAIRLLFLLSAWPPALSEAATGKAVRDISGKKLLSGAEYYILPVIRGGGGGLALASRNGTCPLNVAQEGSGVSDGLPIKFYPVTPGEKSVHQGTDANVVFSAATICVQSTVWRLQGPDPGTQRRYVATGGVTGNPGLETLSNWFKIEKYGENSIDYKLVFCPNVCDYCKVICGDIGVFVDMGKRWLGFTDTPFPVMFKKVEETTSGCPCNQKK
ncbi:kunitz trypsin inhibitor 5-like [Aristolochia californica]|uniref:kunitz trypsin inhibitor 5-like n=1 Tax=Aristolochia californica TaxID=171875 RepID=UPI0035DF64B9